MNNLTLDEEENLLDSTEPVKYDKDLLYKMLLEKATRQNTDTAELAAVNREAAQQRAGLGIIGAGETIGRALAGAAPIKGSLEPYKQEIDQRVQDYLKQKQLERNAEYDKFQAVKELADLQPKPVKPLFERTTVSKDGKEYVIEYDVGNPSNQRVIGLAPKKESSAGIGRGLMPYGQSPEGIDLMTDKQGRVFEFNPSTGAFDKPYKGAGGVKRTGVGETQEKVVKALKQDVDKELVDIKTTEDLNARASALLNTNDPGAVPTAATMMATAIQKGVLTDRDFNNGSGVPVDVIRSGADAIQKYLLAQSPSAQLATMRRIIDTAELYAAQKRENIKSTYGNRLKDKKIDVPESQWYTPRLAPVLKGGLSPEKKSRLEELRAKRAAGTLQ